MSIGLLMLLFGGDTAAEPCDELKRDMIALELFMRDQVDKEDFCPKISWVQPDISVYKDKLESQLPKECKKTSE